MAHHPSVRVARWFLRFLGALFLIAAVDIARHPEGKTDYALPICIALTVLFLGVGQFGTDRAVRRLAFWLH